MRPPKGSVQERVVPQAVRSTQKGKSVKHGGEFLVFGLRGWWLWPTCAGEHHVTFLVGTTEWALVWDPVRWYGITSVTDVVVTHPGTNPKAAIEKHGSLL